MRLIDADEAIPTLEGLTEQVQTEGATLVKALVFAALKSRSVIPTVDAVPVVRCKDCDNWYGGDCGDDEQWHSCSLDALLRQGNWFCAGGRRRCG